MNAVVTEEIEEIIKAVHYRPAVSMILPFEPKITSKGKLVHALKIALDKVSNELKENYADEMVLVVMRKLITIVKELNFNTVRKSIAIYVSPVFQKVLYLDIVVDEKIIIDESFEIRDLVYNKKQSQQYLLLLLNGKKSRVYRGNSHELIKIGSDTAQIAFEYKHELPEGEGDYADKSKWKETRMHKFLQQIDNSMSITLSTYPLPLIVMGTEKIMGHFKSLTKHEGCIVKYVAGKSEDASLEYLQQILKPVIGEWQKLKQKDLLNQMERAAGQKKLAVGISDVWREATKHKGRLLIVEKNYTFTAQHGSRVEIIYEAVEPFKEVSYIKDAVDDVIEKVLENGGDVEFVEGGFLTDFQRIALIQYY